MADSGAMTTMKISTALRDRIAAHVDEQRPTYAAVVEDAVKLLEQEDFWRRVEAGHANDTPELLAQYAADDAVWLDAPLVDLPDEDWSDWSFEPVQ